MTKEGPVFFSSPAQFPNCITSSGIVFLEVRVVGGLTGWENLGESVTETIAWACVAFSLLFADIVLQWQDLRRTKPAPARIQAPTRAPDPLLLGEKAPG